MNQLSAHKIIQRIKKLRNEKMCLAPSPDCEGRIIRAHSISENLMLKPIARNGHVFTWVSELKPTPGINDKLHFEERGINQTSVLYGFCEKHDRILFSCIEAEQFVCSRKQLSTLYFRAVAREYYAKLKQFEAIVKPDEYREMHGISKEAELDPSLDILLYQLSLDTAVFEIHDLKKKIDEIIKFQDYTRIVSQVIEIEGIIPVVCSGFTNPDFDFNGNLIQDISDLTRPLHGLSLSIIPQDQRSFVVLSYLDTHACSAERLIDSLLSSSDVVSDIIWMTFCHFENSAYSPDWIDSLSNETRGEFRRAMFSNINLFSPDFGILADRKIELPGFRVVRTFQL